MASTECVLVPTISALWNKYYTYNTTALKGKWYEWANVHNECAYEKEVSQDSVRAWYHIMALTELIKMRKGWDHKVNMPFWEEVDNV